MRGRTQGRRSGSIGDLKKRPRTTKPRINEGAKAKSSRLQLEKMYRDGTVSYPIKEKDSKGFPVDFSERAWKLVDLPYTLKKKFAVAVPERWSGDSFVLKFIPFGDRGTAAWINDTLSEEQRDDYMDIHKNDPRINNWNDPLF